MLKTTLSSLIFIVSVNYVYSEKSEAKCVLKQNPTSEGTIEGTVMLRQDAIDAPITYVITIRGFTTNGKEHGFHVHELPNIADSCDGAKGHFNPHNMTHGGPEDVERHVGDLGNVEVIDQKIDKTMTDKPKMGNLFLNQIDTIINRTIVIHEKNDDLGKGGAEDSKTTGNAGKRLACCVITCVKGDCLKSSAIFETRLSLWTILLVSLYWLSNVV